MMGIALFILVAGTGNATAPIAGEEALFVSSTQPDALILLDLSGSMEWNPAGDDLTYGSTNSCYADTANCTGSGCSGGYCGSSQASTTFYAASACGTADTTNCVGSGCANGFCSSSKATGTFYAASACGTANTTNCRGTGCGRADGFCNNAMAASTYYAHSDCSTPDYYHCEYDKERRPDCSNGFCATAHETNKRSCKKVCTTGTCMVPCSTGSCSVSCTSGGCTKNCSRLNIAKRSIFNILDDNGDSTINATDEGSLGVRLGYMRYYDCGSDDTGASYSTGCNKLIKAIGTSYSTINTSVQSESATGGTPLASAVTEAGLYLTAHKAADAAKSCRQKFVILITDGSDTYACSGDGAECDSHRYQNRRETVARAKALSDAGFKVFVIGFGSVMPPYLKNTLNWMAYYGGTDNPNEANSGSTTGYSIVTAKDCSATTPADTTKCCNLDTTACYPTGVTGCTAAASVNAACYDSTHPITGSGVNQSNFKASSNDPGYLDLSGYAFLAADADALVSAVKAAINIIREATYSFSQASIQSSRTSDENFVYEGSFQPINGDPFWLGHLRKYQILSEDVKNAAGVVVTPAGSVGAMLLDAGTVLQSTAYTARNISTCVGCTTVSPSTLTNYSYALNSFSTSIDKTYFGAATDAARDAIVGYIQGNATYNPDNWKLGDVFRSTPVTVGTPSAFFDDFRDASSSSVTCCPDNSTKTVNAFGAHRCTHCRTSALGTRLIVAGANDGQFHAFKTSDMTEAWSFVPPNLLSKLKNITHAVEPSALVHQYFVDGPVSGADVWLGSGTGTSKSASDWKTMLVFGEGRGSTDRLWSSAADCASGLSPTYSATYSNYCGYYALDLNDSLNPRYMWRLNGFDATTQAPYMGESWSKMFMGRIMTKSGSTVTEKWVGFVGGGYNANACPKNGACSDTRGKGFYVVDLSNGSILWSFTHGTTASTVQNPTMIHSLPAPPSIVDSDNDGFIDTAYIGDLGGNMWRFKFCTKAMLGAGSCGTSNWNGTIFVDSSSGSIRPIHTGAAVARDALGNLWVFYGTGDKVDPTASNAQEYFYAVKDIDRTSTIDGVSSIDQIANASQVYDATNKPTGYRISLPGQGQKILAEPTVFGGVAYFTSFTPGQANDPCDQAGDASLNAVNFTTGAGVFTPTTANPNPRQMSIGSGIASAPILSLKPGGTSGSAADLYVTVSGGGLSSSSTQKINFDPPGVSNRTNMIYWKDRRIE